MTWVERYTRALYRLARPYLTVLIATLFNVVCVFAWASGELSAIEYITAVGPTNSMIIGFWFGERAATKAGSDGKDSE